MSFRVSRNAVVPQIRTHVYVRGTRRSNIYCTSVEQGIGASGAVAGFELPAADWDDAKSGLRGASVTVQCGYAGKRSEIIFSGRLWSVVGRAGGVVTVEGISPLLMADRVFGGQRAGRYSLDYPSEVEVPVPPSGLLELMLALLGVERTVTARTGWTAIALLVDLWGSGVSSWRGGGGGVPVSWQTMLQLGDLSVLTRPEHAIALPAMRFERSSLSEILDAVATQVGGVSYREAFLAGGRSRLDWFALGDVRAPRKRVRIARPGHRIEPTNVAEIDHTEGLAESVSRVVVLGDNAKYVVSVTTESDHPLEKLWNESLEAEVLANPEATMPTGANNSPEGDVSTEASDPRLHRVFRRYRLPSAFRGLLIDSDLSAVELANGEKMPIQVWRKQTKKEVIETSNNWVTTWLDYPTLIRGASFDPVTQEIVLPEPAVDVVGAGPAYGSGDDPLGETGPFGLLYAEAVVGITLVVNGPQLVVDTGASGASVDDLDDGLTAIEENRGYRYVALTNIAEGDGGTGIDAEYGDVWFQISGERGEGEEVWFHTEELLVLRDDRADLARFAAKSLVVRGKPEVAYAVVTPYWTPGYRVGDQLVVEGQRNFRVGPHTIQSVGYDLVGTGHKTTLRTDAALPAIRHRF